MACDLTADQIDEVILDALEQPFEVLLAGVAKYEDRFMIAMRAHVMARSDQRYDVSEQVGFEQLAEAMGIEEGDRDLIETLHEGLSSDALRARLMELHRGSSFHREDL
jgi:hypothetical protein